MRNYKVTKQVTGVDTQPSHVTLIPSIRCGVCQCNNFFPEVDADIFPRHFFSRAIVYLDDFHLGLYSQLCSYWRLQWTHFKSETKASSAPARLIYTAACLLPPSPQPSRLPRAPCPCRPRRPPGTRKHHTASLTSSCWVQSDIFLHPEGTRVQYPAMSTTPFFISVA